MGRNLALHMHYYPSFYPTPGTNYVGSPNFEAEMADDVSHHRIPVISMVCGDSLESIAQMKGADKTAIDTAANAIGALKTPVFLRFFWEFDLDVNGDTKNGDSANCFNQNLPLTSSSGPSRAGDFVAAWEAIHNEFAADHVTNVAWLWCPTGGWGTVGSPNQLTLTENQLAQFLPPSMPIQYVDWIGVDAYDWGGTGLDGTIGAFYTFYQHQVSSGQPILVAETGENSTNYQLGRTPQYQYLGQALSEIPSTYPQIRGFMYFDDPGQSSNDWSFNANGLSKWDYIANQPVFAPTLLNP